MLLRTKVLGLSPLPGLTAVQAPWTRGKEIRRDFYAGFPHGSESKEFALNVGTQGSIPGLGRYLGVAHANSLQYSCLENLMDRGA